MSKSPEDRDEPRRRRTRFPDYDYTMAGAYFVTICTLNRLRLFGRIRNGVMELNAFGQIIDERWHALPDHHPHVTLDAFIVMPDHIHAVLWLNETSQTGKRHGLSEVIRGFKTFSAHRVNALRQTPVKPLWQRGFYEHVVRNDQSLNDIRKYIEENPLRWELKHGAPLEIPSAGNRAGLNPPLHPHRASNSSDPLP